MTKRILSILLTLCIIICLVPLTTFAATRTADSWSGLQSLMNGTDNLSVSLSNDISWGGSSLNVPAGKTVTLDLNGKAIDAKSSGTVIVVNGTLTIKNSGADLAGPIGVGAGPITGNIKNGKASDQEAGGILVKDGGKLIMNSGWLTNCVDESSKLTSAGGIFVSENAEFEMNGGIITGCTGIASAYVLCAAGVVNRGTFTMSENATIAGSKNKNGNDGIAVCNAGTFNANGGVIQTGQSSRNYATIQNTGKNSTVFYCDVLNTGLGTISGGTYNYPIENAGIITGGIFGGMVTSDGTIEGGVFNGNVENSRVVTGGTFNGATSGIYTVTFDSGVPSQIRANAPAEVPAAPTKKGYTFKCWLKGGAPYDFTQNVTENTALTADWTAKNYTVKFDANGGAAIADKSLTWNDRVLDGVSTPAKTGYDFKGWTFGGKTVSENTVYADIAADDAVTSITLTAQWAIHLYTVTFDYNDADRTKTTTTIAYGEEFGQMPVPVQETYVFAGWYDQLSGGRRYGDENGNCTSPYYKTEDSTLYARWDLIRRTVIYNANGGILTGPDKGEFWQNSMLPEPSDPVRTGYDFTGWYTNAACTNKWNFYDWATGDMTLYAGWQINRYTITFDTAGGSEIAPVTQDYNTNVNAPADPTREGYRFDGWDKEIPDTMPGEDIKITAKWSINQYTITFDTAGGSEIAPVTQDYNTVVNAPADPTREGYRFDGWDKKIPDTMPAGDITITAQWTDIEKPTGKIIIGTNIWNKLLSGITFRKFFNNTQTVKITAEDNSGTDVKIEYLLSDGELTKAELESAVFTEYKDSFSINPDNKYIIYARLTDTAGNADYICSEGIVLDGKKPVISGVKNGKIYCKAPTVTVTEEYLYTVTVNGKPVFPDENNRFVLAAASDAQKIVVTDEAGNSAEVTVTVNADHTFGSWQPNGDGTHTRKCSVDAQHTESGNCTGGTAACTEKAKCELCRGAYGNLAEHPYSGDWSSNEQQHWHACTACTSVKDTEDHKDADKNHNCDICGRTFTVHAGGTATCKDKAICETCKAAYGSLDPKNHANLKHVPAKAATTKAEGNTEYWYCDGCDKYFADAAAEKAITKESTVTAKLPEEPKSPQTGDGGNIAIWIACLALGGAAGVYRVRRKKRKNRE